MNVEPMLEPGIHGQESTGPGPSASVRLEPKVKEYDDGSFRISLPSLEKIDSQIARLKKLT